MMRSICCYENFLYPSGVGSALEYGLNHGLKPVAIAVISPPGFQDVLRNMCMALYDVKIIALIPKKLRLKAPSFPARYLCILFFSVILSSPQSLYSQEGLITANFENTPLPEVLNAIGKICGIKLAYDYDLAETVSVSVQLMNANAEAALLLSLQNTSLGYIYVNEVYIIKPRDELPEIPEETKLVIREVKISGLVRETGTMEHLPYASINLEGTHRGTSTNSDGFFTLVSDYADSIPLMISYIGYHPVRLIVFPEKADDLHIIEMNRRSDLLEEVKIFAHFSQDIVQTFTIPGRMAINAERMQEIPSLNGLDVAAPLQMLPGIDGTTENASGLSIRKSPSDKNLIIYDGFTIYHIDHFFGMFTAFNSKAIKDIRIHKGGYNASYGGRAGGIIEITGKSGDMSGFSANAGMDMLSGNLFIETPVFGKSSIVITARRSFTDVFRSSLYKSLFNKISYDIENTGNTAAAFIEAGPEESVYYFYDYTAKYTWRPNEKDVVSLSTYRGYDGMDFEGLTERAKSYEESDWGNTGSSLRWARKWSKNFYHNLLLGHSGYHLNFMHSDSLSRIQLNPLRSVTIARELGMSNAVSDKVFNLNNQLRISQSNQLDFGLAMNELKTEFDDFYKYYSNQKSLSDTITREKASEVLTAFYLQNNYSNGRLNLLNLGFRISAYKNKSYLEPRFSAAYNLLENLSLKTSYGIHNQFINRILLLEEGQTRFLWTLSDGKRLPIVKSRQLSGGLIWNPMSSLTLDAEVYLINSEGMMAVQNRMERGSNANSLQWKRVYYHYGNTTKGLDLLLKKIKDPWQFWLAYSYSLSMDNSNHINSGLEYPAFNDQAHELKLLSVFNKKDWTLSASWIVGSGKPWDKPVFATGLQLDPDYRKNSERLPVYHRLDAGLSKEFRFEATLLSMGFNIFNLYNQLNVISRPYALSEEPVRDVIQGRSPLVFNEIQGRGFAINFFMDFHF